MSDKSWHYQGIIPPSFYEFVYIEAYSGAKSTQGTPDVYRYSGYRGGARWPRCKVGQWVDFTRQGNAPCAYPPIIGTAQGQGVYRRDRLHPGAFATPIYRS